MNPKSKNIFIGYNAGENFTTETNRLVINKPSGNIDISITDDEYNLLALAMLGVFENFDKAICDCSRSNTGNCSTLIGRSALGCKDICVKIK